MRIDTAVRVDGLRINVWVSMVVLTLGIVMFVFLGARQKRSDRVPRAELAATPQADVVQD
jgi:hypothetical protein